MTQKGNTSNNLYNLMTQLVEENKGLWQIKTYYQEDSGECEKCKALWKKMIDSKEEFIAELEATIKHHI